MPANRLRPAAAAMRTLLLLAAARLVLGATPLPLATANATRLVYASCNDPKLGPSPLWGRMRSAAPDVFLWGGDNVYNDQMQGLRESLAEGRFPLFTPLPREQAESNYALLNANPDYEAIKARAHVFAVWDDHDFGTNDGDSTYVGKLESKDLFLRHFLRAPASDARYARPGIYSSQIFAVAGGGLFQAGFELRVIGLDVRTFKSPWTVPPLQGECLRPVRARAVMRGLTRSAAGGVQARCWARSNGFGWSRSSAVGSSSARGPPPGECCR
jgi:hypothetical protein